jgi:hypothetical protein
MGAALPDPLRRSGYHHKRKQSMPYTPQPPGRGISAAELGRQRVEQMRLEREQRERDAQEKQREVARLREIGLRQEREIREAEAKAAKKSGAIAPAEPNPFCKGEHWNVDKQMSMIQTEPEKANTLHWAAYNSRKNPVRPKA